MIYTILNIAMQFETQNIQGFMLEQDKVVAVEAEAYDVISDVTKNNANRIVKLGYNIATQSLQKLTV